MNKWKKAGLAVTASAAVISTAHIINQMIFSSSVIKNLTNKETRSFAYSRFKIFLLIMRMGQNNKITWQKSYSICHRPAWMWSFR